MGTPELEHGSEVKQLVGERLEPAKQRGILSPPAHFRDCQLDQVRSSLEVLGGQRVADRIARRTMTFVPLARAPVQCRDLLGLLCQQMRSEHVSKEVVIAIPVAFVIERNDKEVASLQGFQPRAAFFLTSDGIAQRTTQPVENGGLAY